MFPSLSQIIHTMSLEVIYQRKKWGEVLDSSMQASTIIYLSKAKEKDGKEVIGNIIKAKTHKSRLSKENKEVKIRLYYDERGLDKYYGLLELGEIGGLWKNVAGRYEINGKKVYGKQILANPDDYFIPEVMHKLLEETANREFSYGTN